MRVYLEEGEGAAMNIGKSLGTIVVYSFEAGGRHSGASTKINYFHAFSSFPV